MDQKNLSEWNIDELAKLVASGADTSAQKAQPLLIAKAMVELAGNVRALQEQIPQTIGNGADHMIKKLDELNDTLVNLKGEINGYSVSSSRHAFAIEILTAGLVLVGFLQIFGPALIRYFNK